MKKTVEITGKFILLLLGGIVLGTAALILVYLLPKDRMETNVRSSMEVFYTESVYPQQAPGYKTTQLDNETDAIMLLGAIYDGGGYPVWQQAMRVARIDFKEVPSCCNDLIRYAWENQVPDGEEEYSRYWHGYMLWLKPLLLFLDYADLRILNMMLQVFLLLWLVKELVEKGQKRYLLPFGMAVAVLNPAAAAMSLQFTSIYDIVLISMILMLRRHEKWETGKKYPYLFFLLGMVTVFFDFLTYPTAALCMPLVLYLLLERKDWKDGLKAVFIFGFCFSAGYAGMWIGKWLMGSLLLQENVIRSAIAQMTMHTGDAVVSGQALSKADVIFRNLKVLMKWPYLYVAAGGFLLCASGISIGQLKGNLNKIVPVLAVCLIPFVWLCLTASHAAWCYWYTYRGLMASAFGVFGALKMLPQRERK